MHIIPKTGFIWLTMNTEHEMWLSELSLQHLSFSSIALSILPLPRAHSTPPLTASHQLSSFPVRLSVASPQLSLKASLTTSTWHQGSSASAQIKLLKLFCQGLLATSVVWPYRHTTWRAALALASPWCPWPSLPLCTMHAAEGWTVMLG